MTTPGSLGKNLLLLFLSLLLALALCEVVLRFYNPLGFRIKGDNIILPVNKKETLYHDKHMKIDAVVVQQNNSLGFKGPEPPADFARRLTVLTVGGSTTECLEIAPEKSWPRLLGERLEESFSGLWLNNAGLSGHSTYGHYILVRDYLAKLKPKVLIFLVGINEIGTREAREPDTRMSTALSFRSLDRFLASLAYRSEVASAALNLYRYYFPKSVLAIGQRSLGELDYTTLPILTMSAAEKAALKKTYVEELVPLYEPRLRRLLAISRDNGMTPVVLTQPALYAQRFDDLTGIDFSRRSVRAGLNGEVGWEILEMYNDITRKVAREEGVLVIDLAREMPRGSRYYYDLMHFSNAGCKEVAAITARYLTPYLAERFPAFYAPPVN